MNPLILRSDLTHLTLQDTNHLLYDWRLWARKDQLPPDLTHPSWQIWLTLAGRGWGKTRTGSQQVLHWVDQGYRRIHIIAPTTADTRDVIVDGESGILNVAHPSRRPLYEPSKRRLTFPNGAIALLFSAEEPERLRGPQCDAMWCDELAAWQYAQETWDMAMFGLRLGKHPRVFISTTPRPIPLIRSLIARSLSAPSEVVLTTGSTYENKANLAPIFFGQVAQYEGTRLGDQELYAKIIDPNESSIIRRSWMKLFPTHLPLPIFEHIIQSYDTAYTEKTLDRKTREPDPSAQSTWGIFKLTPQLRKDLHIPDNAPFHYATLLLDAWSDHLQYPDLREKVVNEYNMSTYNERTVDTVLIENKGSGISLRQDLQREVPVVPYNPGKADKLERLHSVSYLPARGLVFIPESRANPQKPVTWAEPFLEQLCSFPLTANDDYVDTFSQALAFMKDSGWLTIDTLDEDQLDEYVKETRKANPYGR